MKLSSSLRQKKCRVNNETSTRIVQVEADLEDDQKRVETLNTTTVWNDTFVVTFNEDENSVTEYEVNGTTLLPSIKPLANESVISYEYLGTETIDSQETYVLGNVNEEHTQ